MVEQQISLSNFVIFAFDHSIEIGEAESRERFFFFNHVTIE